MPTIMVTNDDGVNAPGIEALARRIEQLAPTYVVAPDRERSASGHSLTLHKPLRVTKLSERKYCINGTPTDCVAIGLEKVMPERPALLISGINSGPNLGDDITYSGTVSAAMEGTIMNIPSIAVSLNISFNSTAQDQPPHFETAAEVAAQIATHLLQSPLPYDTLLNINVPNLPLSELKGHKLTRQGKRVYDGAIKDSQSPWGERYYWIGGGTPYWEHGEDTDISAVLAGYVSITPLHLDMTNHWALDYLKAHWKTWNLQS